MTSWPYNPFGNPPAPWETMDAYGPYWYEPYESYEPSPPPLYEEQLWYCLCDAAEDIAADYVSTELRKRPRPVPSFLVGWSAPPHPTDVVVSFNPKASKSEQAKAVLLDYYRDNDLRGWADNGDVKKAFIGGDSPKKENHDPLLLVAAYQNPNDKIWKQPGVSWKDLDRAVQGAISRRKKLGPLPKAVYADQTGAPANPITLYYYDHDYMKRITYPLLSVPGAINPENPPETRYWALYQGPSDAAHIDAGLDKPHTLQVNDPRRIQIERENPGWKTKAELLKIMKKYPKDFAPPMKMDDPMHPARDTSACPNCTGKIDMNLTLGSAGAWGEEGFDWDRDVAGTGIIGSITGAILALVSAVLTATGVGAIVGVPLGIATPLIVAAINDLDVGLHTGDFGAGLSGLATAIIQAAGSAAGSAGVSIPPAALKALGGTVTAISNAVREGEKKKLDFAQIWQQTAQKAKGFGKLGDEEAIAIAHMLTGQGPSAGHVFIQGYLAGKFLDAASMGAVAKLLQGMLVYGADARIVNLGLLGMGIGHVSKTQKGLPATSVLAKSPATGGARATATTQSAPSRATSHGTHATRGAPELTDDLESFVVGVLYPRYGLGFESAQVGYGRASVGFDCPPGFDLVATDSQIACAYRGKAVCLAGAMDERGQWLCTARDFDCPPGMATRKGSPPNWCFPIGGGGGAGGGAKVGQVLPPPAPTGEPDWTFPALGCPHGYWRDDLSGGICRPVPPKPPTPPAPRTGFYDPYYDPYYDPEAVLRLHAWGLGSPLGLEMFMAGVLAPRYEEDFG